LGFAFSLPPFLRLPPREGRKAKKKERGRGKEAARKKEKIALLFSFKNALFPLKKGLLKQEKEQKQQFTENKFI
jgi:hypothetical protein